MYAPVSVCVNVSVVCHSRCVYVIVCICTCTCLCMYVSVCVLISYNHLLDQFYVKKISRVFIHIDSSTEMLLPSRPLFFILQLRTKIKIGLKKEK